MDVVVSIELSLKFLTISINRVVSIELSTKPFPVVALALSIIGIVVVALFSTYLESCLVCLAERYCLDLWLTVVP